MQRGGWPAGRKVSRQAEDPVDPGTSRHFLGHICKDKKKTFKMQMSHGNKRSETVHMVEIDSCLLQSQQVLGLIVTSLYDLEIPC